LIGIPVLEEGIAAFIGNMRRSLIGLIETRFWEGMGLLGRQKRAILYPSGVNYRLRGDSQQLPDTAHRKECHFI